MSNIIDPHIEKLRHALLQFHKRTAAIVELRMGKEARSLVTDLPPEVVEALAVEGLHMLGVWIISAMAEIDEPERQRNLVEKITGRKVPSADEILKRDFPEHASQL